jgi:hypothetical protein
VEYQQSLLKEFWGDKEYKYSIFKMKLSKEEKKAK